MKNLLLLILISVLIQSCTSGNVNTNNLVLTPDQLGQELFKVYKSDNIADLKRLCATIEEALIFIEKSGEMDKLDNSTIEFIEKCRIDDSFRNERNNRYLKNVLGDYIGTRSRLINLMKYDIQDYYIAETYLSFNKDPIPKTGSAIIVLKHNLGDEHYLYFELTEVAKNNFRLYDDIRISDTIKKPYVKYKYYKELEKLDE